MENFGMASSILSEGWKNTTPEEWEVSAKYFINNQKS